MARSAEHTKGNLVCQNHPETAAAALCKRHDICLCLTCILNRYHEDCDSVETLQVAFEENDYKRISDIIQLKRDLEKARKIAENQVKHTNTFEADSVAKIRDIKKRLDEKTKSLESHSHDEVKTLAKVMNDAIMCRFVKLETLDAKLKALVSQISESDKSENGLIGEVSCTIGEIKEELRMQDTSYIENSLLTDRTCKLKSEVHSYLELDSSLFLGRKNTKWTETNTPTLTEKNNYKKMTAASRRSSRGDTEEDYEVLNPLNKDGHIYESVEKESNVNTIILNQHEQGKGPCKLTKLLCLGDNFIAVCDSSHDYIHLYRMNGKYVCGISFELNYDIKDICLVEKDMLAVASQNQPMITTVKLSQEQLTKYNHISVKGYIRSFQSLRYDTEMKLYAFCSYKDVFIVNVFGSLIQSISFGKSPKRLITFRLNKREFRPSLSVSKYAVYDFETRSVYVSDAVQGTVQRHSLDRQELVWKQSKGLHRPRFLQIFGQKVYVACQHAINVLAADSGESLYCSSCNGENISVNIDERNKQVLVTQNSEDNEISRTIKYMKW